MSDASLDTSCEGENYKKVNEVAERLIRENKLFSKGCRHDQLILSLYGDKLSQEKRDQLQIPK